MSKLSRYNLLTSLVRHELKSEHVQAIDQTAVEHNIVLYQRSIEAWIFLTEDLMCENGLKEQARDTRIINLLNLFNNHNISLTLLLLKKVYDILINHISHKKILSNFIDFKGQFTQEEVPLLGFLLSPIKESLNHVIDSQTVISSGCYRNESTRSMWICSHYLLFLTKINFKNSSLENKALIDYLEFEDETSRLDISNCDQYLKPLQIILSDWLKDWSYDGFRSKHGSGSVADCKKHKIEKYLSFATDKKILRLYHNDKAVTDSVLPFGGLVRSLERQSKLEFVPKNISKLRSISMEPATLQYLQQGCMESLYNYFEENHQLRKILKLSDQSQNKSFAYDGSITDRYATIDLSHASDSVNWALTKVLFKKVPKLLYWLICTRSTHTLLPDGTSLELTKFAPMGSALCFPIESLIFAAIAKLSIQLSIEEDLDRDNDTGIRSRNTFLTVYGDDIIIPSFAAEKCITLLRLFGFTPNEDKSYLHGPFKESCGGNYFCGYDITALKYAPAFDKHQKLGVSPEAYTALCSYANLAYERGLYLFRLHCIKLIFEAGKKPVFVDNFDEAPGIYSPTPTNFHLKKVYIKRYQKYQLIYTGVKTVEKTVSEDLKPHVGHIFLYDYLLNKNINDREGVATSLLQLNARVKDGCIVFDCESPYARSTLLPQVLKYTLCKKDISLS